LASPHRICELIFLPAPHKCWSAGLPAKEIFILKNNFLNKNSEYFLDALGKWFHNIILMKHA